MRVEGACVREREKETRYILYTDRKRNEKERRKGEIWIIKLQTNVKKKHFINNHDV